MKKIILGKRLEEQKAICDFCGENNKDCVKGSENLIVSFPKLSYEKIAILDAKKHYKSSIFGESYYKIPKSEPIFVHVQDGDCTTSRTYTSYICKDCIRQLAQLIKLNQ